ncbi:MAG: RNA-binding S4 domain-containing protein [Rhodospirillaceae bacterium]|nr:RNA-binding S4 domain-containing protein [Rhodospirillaceae bacterium]
MSEALRIDRWLWFARFFRSRSLAAKICAERRVRVNGTIVTKPNHRVRTGDILTFPQGREIRVVRVAELGFRRGPAAEAQTLFEDLSGPPDPDQADLARRDSGAGRPTKADRRDIMRFVGKG